MDLERASYVFGIVGSIATVISLFVGWRAHRLRKEGGGLRSPALAPSEERKILSEIPSSGSDDQLMVAFSNAKKVYIASDRDTALIAVARKAIQAADWKLAVEVSKAVFYATTKDMILREIVDSAIAAKQWLVAEAASELMFYVTSKDAAKRAIVTAATK